MAASPKVPGNRLTFRSWGGSAKLTEGFFPYKKRRKHHFVKLFRLFIVSAVLAVLLPRVGGAQLIFDWPVRVTPQPETVITGAGAVFWNPGSLVSEVGTSQEVWLTHVDGPDATGVRGVAVSGVSDLPKGFRIGIGYWHLGIRDIPRTITSPHQEAGEINISEDVGVILVSRGLGPKTGVGGGIRFERGAAGREAKSRIVGELGVHHQSGLPLTPRFGVALHGLGGELGARGGVEVSLPPLAAARVPIRLGYGIHLDDALETRDHRFSLRTSWMDEVLMGVGVSYLGEGNGWVPLWHLGANLGRYSFSVLRESLANSFGAIHFFQASIRFP